MKEIKQVLKEFYGITPTKIEKLDITSTNNQFKIESEKGKFLLKENFKFHAQKIGNLLYKIDVANHLIENGINTPKHIENKHGSALTEHDNKNYILLDFIEGKTFEKDSDIEQLAEILVKFHNSTKNFSSGHASHTNPAHTQKGHEVITKLFEKARDENESLLDFIKTVEKTDFIKRLEGDIEFIYLCIVKAFQSVKNTNFTEETILHYDFKHDNLMVDEKEEVHVLDFDFSHKGYVEFDLVKAAKYKATNEDETEIDIEVFKQFIEAYKKHKPIVASMKDLYGLLLYIVLRRLIYASNYTIRGRADLEFLYDKDIKLLNYLESNKEMFANDN